MPGLKRYLLENQVYHTVSTTRGREPVFADEELAGLLVGCIQGISQKRMAHVLAFAVMPDHLHLLVVPRSPTTLPRVMQSLKGYSSRLINERRGQRGSIWQQTYFDRVIRTEAHLQSTVDYIEHNPVSAKLVSTPEEYQFSSAHRKATNDRAAWLEADRRGWKASAT